MKEFLIAGAPDWLKRFDSAYDIEGRAAGSVSEMQCREMVQSLFADRFKMKSHFEVRESQVYLLTIARGGPKLTRGGEVRLNGGIQVNADGRPSRPDGLTMAALASLLANYTERPVIDRTGLQGSFGITLDFSLREGDDRVSIFTAVQEQLGLRLEAGRTPVEMLVIDHIQKPDAN